MNVFAEQLFLILTYAGIALGPFVVMLLNSKGATRSRANLFLSILLISFSFSIGHTFFAEAVIGHLTTEVYSVGDPTFFLIAPLLWLYARELTAERIELSVRLSLHFIPFVSIILLSLTLRSIAPDYVFMQFLDHHHKIIIVGFWLILVIQFSAYQLFMRGKWTRYRDFIQQEVSNKEGVDLSWVRFFMIVFLLINVFFLFSLFAAIHLDSEEWLPKATALIFSLSVFALGYKGMMQKEILPKGEVQQNYADTSKPTDTIIKPDQDLINKLLSHMEEKKSFLDPELTLTGLAKELEISRNQLSYLINEGIGDNFYNFVNKYRVEQVKKFIIDPSMKNFNMLGLALEAGFKSKSTFNLIFKRFTGLTPTEYAKNLSKQ